MNDSILKELYEGNIYPAQIIKPDDPRYTLVERKISDEMEYLKKRLNEADGKRLEELGGLYRDASSMDSCESFTYGFKLGALLLCETYECK